MQTTKINFSGQLRNTDVHPTYQIDQISHDQTMTACAHKSVTFYIALDNQKCFHFKRLLKKSISQEDLNLKYDLHNKRRERFLSDRLQRLKARHYQLQYRKMLMSHKFKLMRLKLKSKLEFAQSMAWIRRSAFLQSNIEKWTSRIEHVQNVALIQKFKTLDTLGQVVSNSLMEVIGHESQDTLENAPEFDQEENYEDFNLEIYHPKNLFRFLSEVNIAAKAQSSKSLDPEEFLTLDELSYMDLLSLLPSINRFTLRELDIVEILANAQIRHDLCFDPTLKFKSNIEEGATGDQKRLEISEYWMEVSHEFKQEQFYRVPLFLHEVKVIISELLPKSDAVDAEISEWIDVKLVYQQLNYGVFNPFSTIENLGAIMKRHCAPIRDNAINSMIEISKSGDFSKTLQELFQTLELMKLDYANYQMNRLRPFVIEKAIEFEWRWFKDRVDCEIIGLDATARWIASFGIMEGQLDTRGRLLKYFLELIISLPTLALEEIPETLSLDYERLRSFHSDLQDIGIISCLLLVSKQLVGANWSTKIEENIKLRLKVLLNDEETTVEHLVLDLKNTIETSRDKLLTESEASIISSMVGKYLNSEDTLYKLMLTRVTGNLTNIINGNTFDDHILQKHGLSAFSKEILDLGNKCKELFMFHWDVYHELYNSILQN